MDCMLRDIKPHTRRTVLIWLSLLCLSGCDREAAQSITTDPPNGDPRNSPALASNARSATRVKFTDITAESGLKWTYRNDEEAGHLALLESLGGGVGLLDFDADGLQDAILPGGGEFTGDDLQTISGLPAGVYRHLGPLSFSRVTEHAAVDGSRFYTHGVAASDFNNDGFTDFLLTGYGGLQLFRNLGDGTFVEQRSTETGLSDSLWSSSASPARYSASPSTKRGSVSHASS